MTYFADLSVCTYFGATPEPIIAIGWLDAAHAYPTGPVSAAQFARLMALLASAWQPVTACGVHFCNLCRFTGGPAVVRHADHEAAIGIANLFVPGERGLYAAPSTIAHYIDAHGYAPPAEFWSAVDSCPPMRSPAYLRAVMTYGLHRAGRALS